MYARMKPSGILHLYRLRARERLVPEAFAALGIAVGVALLFASQVANTSLTGSVRELTRGLTGQSQLQLTSRTSSGFDQRLLNGARAIPGVRSASPVLEASANVIGPRGRRSVELIGADPRSVHLGGSLLRHFSAAALARQHAFALPAPVAQAIGARQLEPLKLQLGASTTSALLGIVLRESDIGVLVHSPVALAPLAYAQRLTSMQHRVTRILVQARPGQTDAVRRALLILAAGRINVEPADYDATLFEHAATPTNQSTAVFAAISALVGFLFAFNAILLTLPARRRLVNDVRLDGYGPRTIVKILLLDALVLGAIASLLGLALGDELSIHLFHASPGYLTFAFAIGNQRIVTAQSVAIALLGGMAAACLGVLAPMQDVLGSGSRRKRRTLSVLVRARWSFVAGLICLLATALIIALAPGAVVIGVVTLTAALLLLLPGLLAGVIYLFKRATLGVRAKAPSVAVAELRSTWPRTVAIAATGAVAVFGSVAIDGAHADLQRGLDRSARDVSTAANVWAFPPGLNNLLATTAFSPGAYRSIAHLAGVRAVLLYRGSFLDYDDRRVWVDAPPTGIGHLVPAHQLVDGNLALANARLREGGWAVISKAIADQHGLRIGDYFTLPSPRPTRLRVAALGTNIGWPPGAVVINANDYSLAWESDEASAYAVLTSSGAAPAVRGEVQRLLGPASGLSVQTASEREQRQRAASRQGLSRLTQISTLVLIAAVLAMAAAIGNMVWLRRRRLADVKLDGFTDLAVWRTLVLEATILVGAGSLIGAVFGLLGQVLGSHAILGVTGFPVVFSFGVLGALKSVALVTAVAVAITAVPGYFIAKVRPTFSD
jgi:putative ABC transport system permease protein